MAKSELKGRSQSERKAELNKKERNQEYKGQSQRRSANSKGQSENRKR